MTHPFRTRAAVAVLSGGVILAGCSGCDSAAGRGAGSTPSAPRGVTSSAPAATTSAPDPTSGDTDSTGASSTSGGSGQTLAADACRTWATSAGVASAQVAPIHTRAAQQAAQAAAVDPQWAVLAQGMSALAALPLTGLTPDEQNTATTQHTAIRSDCAQLGVSLT